jgi:hypothetical protein
LRVREAVKYVREREREREREEINAEVTLCFFEMQLKGQGEDEGVVLYFVEGK